MKKCTSAVLVLAGLGLLNCASPPRQQTSLSGLLSETDSLIGRSEYLQTPFVSAGDRVYMVGAQNGSFPDLGWHIEGEMGGIWDHPIKLLDGFTATLHVGDRAYCLDQATQFINYPFANKLVFRFPDIKVWVERFHFVPDGKEAIHLEYIIHNEQPEKQNISLEWTAYTDLRPTWLGERTQMIDGPDLPTWDEEMQGWIAKDSLNPWFVAVAASVMPQSHTTAPANCTYSPKGKGTRMAMTYALEVPANGMASLPLTVAGSYKSENEVRQTLATAGKDAAQDLLAKQKRYQEIARQSRLTIPDKQLQTAYEWVKYNTDWLIRDVPKQGRGLSAGLPDYPWWFGVDNTYTLQGAMATGRFDLARQTVDLIQKLSEKENGNGRIIHEVSTNGAVFNPGNVNETPQFVSLIWTMYQWNGDKEFLKTYFPAVKKGLEWLLAENDKDGNLLPDGFGMMEIHGLNSEMIDVAAYTQRAFSDAAQMAQLMGESELATRYAATAAQLKVKINQDFWVPDYRSYADFIGLPPQTLKLIDDALIRADTLKKPWAVEELKATAERVKKLPAAQKQGFVLHHNWVVNTPMETGVADTAKALVALATGSQFVNPYGMFVTGIDRDESAGKDESSFAKGKKVFSYTGAVMTLPTGVQAIAENNYGRPDEALGYLKRMTRSFGYALPGSLYEVSPDYGMVTQAWNLYSYAVPIVQQFFGIKPRADLKTVRIQPQMPSEWPQASLENVQIGDNELSIDFSRKDAVEKLVIFQTKPDWKCLIAFPAGKFSIWTLNGKSVKPKRDGNFELLEISGKEMTVEVSK
ncbi:alpha-L-rhamnosidase-related protein [Arundinibacter roseus]|uniref:Glycogen debranching protein n=1 Tax=Arundinibacter roseus TaxID=2070510 RepID=A0A4R4KII2_9BACT|nr:family 78 glycoside hydrolase catalytic domain [Arundinibacter roseus]TDB67994.1 glycogen debranching protein [Arundinibacter roseus]